MGVDLDGLDGDGWFEEAFIDLVYHDNGCYEFYLPVLLFILPPRVRYVTL